MLQIANRNITVNKDYTLN